MTVGELKPGTWFRARFNPEREDDPSDAHWWMRIDDFESHGCVRNAINSSGFGTCYVGSHLEVIESQRATPDFHKHAGDS